MNASLSVQPTAFAAFFRSSSGDSITENATESERLVHKSDIGIAAGAIKRPADATHSCASTADVMGSATAFIARSDAPLAVPLMSLKVVSRPTFTPCLRRLRVSRWWGAGASGLGGRSMLGSRVRSNNEAAIWSPPTPSVMAW